MGRPARIGPVEIFLRNRNDAAVSELRDEVARSFGQKLSVAREKAGLSQDEVSYRSSMHRTEIGELERSIRIPKLDTVIKLAGALEIEPCELMPDVRWVPPAHGDGEVRRT